MIKVLVAEDELPLLRGISRLIEKLDADFQVVMMAKNGKEALDYLQNHPVDIVFTDINMPVLDGVEVLKYINQTKPQLHRVVISGYQDFSYAQQALKYGAKRYLIKPVDKQELLLLLEELKDDLSSSIADKKDWLLRQYLFGNNQAIKYSAQPEPLKAEISFGKLYPVYLIAKAYCNHGIEEDVFDSAFWQKMQIWQRLQTQLPALKNGYIYYGKHLNEMMLLLETTQEIDAQNLIDQFLKNAQTDFPLAAAVGEACTEISEIRKTMKQLRKLICMEWVYGISQQIKVQEQHPAFCITKTTEEALQYMVKNGKFKEFQGILTELQKRMATEQIRQYDLERTLNKIIRFIQSHHAIFVGEEIENIEVDINEIVVRAGGLKEVFDEFLFWCHNKMFPTEEENTKALLWRLDFYIQNHYTEPLSTKMLAQEFGLVPSYLSRLFREYKGVTPNQYIQEIRIEKSKEILIHCPSIMTKDIALMVGYTDSSYFSKVFKKSTQMYPSEYRIANLP